MAITTKKSSAYGAIVGVTSKKTGVYTAVQGVYAKVAGAYQRVDAVTPISISVRQALPSGVGNVSTNSSDNYRIWDYALQPVNSPWMGYANMASYATITGKQQEQPNISHVYVTASVLTNVDTSLNIDQSAATLTRTTWTKAVAGTPGYIWKLVGNSRVDVSAATFAADGGLTVDGGATILVPPGYYVACDEMTGLVGMVGWWARQVELSGVAPVTLTIPAATYTAGTAVPYSGGTPTNNWNYLATGTGVTAVTANFDDSTGTVASVNSSGVLTLSRDFTSTGGTITLSSRWPVTGVGGRGTATTGDFRKISSSRGLAVNSKNWTSISPSSQNGQNCNDFTVMIGTSPAGMDCMLIPETSLGNGHHDQLPDSSYGDIYGATGPYRRACTINKIPSVKTAVSGSSMQREVPSSAFTGAAYGPLKTFLAGFCNMMLLSGPYNTRAFQWAGASITTGAGGKLLYQSYINAYRNACRTGAATTVYACSMLPGASGTFATLGGQTAAPDNADSAKMQINQRAWVNSPGTWVQANGDPDVGIDILPSYYSLAAANGLTNPGADVPSSIASTLHPYSADWVSASYRGSTLEGVHPQYTVATYLAPVIAASLPMYS